MCSVRALGTARPYSDLDLAQAWDRCLTLDTMAALADDLSESDLPYRVDLLDAAVLDPAFRARLAEAWILSRSTMTPDAPSDRLSVTVRLRPEDAAAASLAARAVSIPTAAVAIAGLGAVIGGGVGVLLNRALDADWTAGAWFAGALPGALILLWLGARRFATGQKTDDRSDEPVTVTITPDGLEVVHTDFIARHAWRGLAEVEERPALILVRTQASGAFVLPRRDFADDAAAAAFVAALRRGMAGGG